MEVITTNEPATEAAAQLSEHIASHNGTTLCFLAGGSALGIVSALQLAQDQKRRTIFMMGDERWSRERSESNYLQLTDLLSESDSELTIVNTAVKEAESFAQFIERLQLELKNIFAAHTDLQTIAVLGVGTDGHTASVFPMDEESFAKTYEADSTYVPVTVEGLTSQHRASLTPRFLHTVDHVIGYATGESKKTILESLLNESKDLHEMPSQLIKLHEDSVLVTDQDVV